MRYLSLFSGIGGFEKGINDMFSEAQCIGFSEIEKNAIQIYSKNFPSHKNIGDITRVNEETIKKLGKCDLVVGGFPCTNLSSMANFRGDNKGLKGSKSCLFYDFLRILKYVMKNNENTKFIIENNWSMRKSEKKLITDLLKDNFKNVYLSVVDNGKMGIQTRKRIIWTNFEITKDIFEKEQSWEDILDSEEKVVKEILTDKMINCLNKCYPYRNKKGETTILLKCLNNLYKKEKKGLGNFKSRWDIHKRTDIADVNCKPITSGSGGGNNILFDRRFKENEGEFAVRKFTVNEIERLFGFPDDWTSGCSDTARKKALGNSIPIFIVKYILRHLTK